MKKVVEISDPLLFINAITSNQDYLVLSDQHKLVHLYNIGFFLYSKNRYSHAFRLTEYCIKLAADNKDKTIQQVKIECLNLLGRIQCRKQLFKSSLAYFEKALEIAKCSGDSLRKSKCYANIALAYRDMKKPCDALNNIQLALVILKGGQSEEIKEIRIRCYINLANVYEFQKNMKKQENS